MTETPRILLARPDHLGDLLLSLPALVWLRSAMPESRMTALVAPSIAAISQRCAAIDQTITAPFPAPDSSAGPDDWRKAMVKLAPALRDRFDIALLPRIDDPWSGALVAAAGIPDRIGFDHPRTRVYLTTALPVPQHQHVARLALQVAGAVAQRNDLPGGEQEPVPSEPWIIPTAADRDEARAVLDACHAHDSRPLVAIHPGAGWPLKSWPLARWGALALQIREAHGIQPLITGSRSEQAEVAAIVAASDGAAIDISGRLSLGGLAALYRAAAVVVANDSGPLHLAAAVGAPVVGLYGPADPDEFGPWAPPERQRVVRSGLPCSPCRTMAAPPCGAVSQPACLRAITVNAVLAALDELLDTRPAVSRS